MAGVEKMKILLVDDDRNIRTTLTVTLQGWMHQVSAAGSAAEAIEKLKSESYDLMLTDYKLGDKTGLDLVKAAKEVREPPISVVMTAFASFENAVNAIKEGAFDYLPKPFSNAQLEYLLQRINVLVNLKRENERLRRGVKSDFFGGLTSPAMVRLEEFVRKIAPTDASVLLIGESGTGKTELSRLIHSRSSRANKAFSVVNCTTLAETLLESELFGHVKGAFTGATSDHVGKLEAANHGTVLIDEVGDLSLNGQARLLRFLQEKVIERVGSNSPIALDVRVIAATNKNLEEAVKEKKFREDLYYRLNMFECSMVPLRYRAEDLPVLIEKFFRESLVSAGVAEAKTLSEPIRKLLLAYPWPGNVRELRNVLERLVLLAKDREIRLDDLPDSIRNVDSAKSAAGAGQPLRSLEEIEREHIERVLAVESNQEKAAQILGITTVTLWRKRKEYGLP
ncbi:MAG: sigma-54-dependent transcriptional regulator [Bdellovibrionota bacterium]